MDVLSWHLRAVEKGSPEEQICHEDGAKCKSWGRVILTQYKCADAKIIPKPR